MNDEAFWTIIATARRDAAGIDDRLPDALADLLREMPIDEVKAFDQRFEGFHAAAYDRRLWCAAYLIQGGCSDDGFCDNRNWLIGQGQAVYEAALRDPDSLVEIVDVTEDEPDVELEELIRVPMRVITEREGDYVAPPSPPSPPLDPDLDPNDEEQMAAAFPRLYERFG